MTARPAQDFTISRIENGCATIETEYGKTFEVPAAWLPKGAIAGDTLFLRHHNRKQDSALHFFIDLKRRQARLSEIEALVKDLLLQSVKAGIEPAERSNGKRK